MFLTKAQLASFNFIACEVANCLNPDTISLHRVTNIVVEISSQDNGSTLSLLVGFEGKDLVTPVDPQHDGHTCIVGMDITSEQATAGDIVSMSPNISVPSLMSDNKVPAFDLWCVVKSLTKDISLADTTMSINATLTDASENALVRMFLTESRTAHMTRSEIGFFNRYIERD